MIVNGNELEVEVDGVRHAIDGVYGDNSFGPEIGMNEMTQPEDAYRNFIPSGKRLWRLRAWWRNPDGSIWGIDGLFKIGEWIAEGNKIIYRVGERIL